MKRNIQLILFSLVALMACENGEVKDEELEPVEGFDRNYSYAYDQTLQDRLFPFFTLMQRSNEVVELLKANTLNDSLLQNFNSIMLQKLEDCYDVKCLLTELKFSSAERQLVQQLLVELSSTAPLNALRADEMLPSGFFIRYFDMHSGEFYERVWQENALAVNNIIDVYGLSKTPSYPDIDSISFKSNDPHFFEKVKQMLTSISDNKYELLFEPYLDIALGLLEVNGRDEAARYVPMMIGENQLAAQAVPSIDWSGYEYSAIVVLGDGPENVGVPIEALGRYRVRLGNDRYKDGLAPILIVTGGHVKPFLTPFAEAVEMKKVLMTDHNVPESAIIIDPHARHTTTNLRNIARLILRYGIPTDKKVLVVTSDSHSTYMTSEKFRSRCLQELKYLPAEIIERVSEEDVAVKVNLTSLHIAPLDPLDP